jgi:hypothetical protein
VLQRLQPSLQHLIFGLRQIAYARVNAQPVGKVRHHTKSLSAHQRRQIGLLSQPRLVGFVCLVGSSALHDIACMRRISIRRRLHRCGQPAAMASASASFAAEIRS